MENLENLHKKLAYHFFHDSLPWGELDIETQKILADDLATAFLERRNALIKAQRNNR